MKLLIQWSNLPPEDSTWEGYYFIKVKFPDFVINPRGQGCLAGEGIVMTLGFQ